MALNENALAKANSKYLRQHAGHPVWWQEWSPGVLKAASQQKKLLFVSVGYSSSHGCHVMANKTFTDPVVAKLLNGNFISIKVDREQRPDIDQYLMDFMVATTGNAGWPLNVFLSPDLKPFLAFSYAPAEDSETEKGLLSIIPQALSYFRRNSNNLSHFSISKNGPPHAAEYETDPIKAILEDFDEANGGFGTGSKYPPHSTLLFLIYRYCCSPSKEAAHVIQTTLDAMACRGLHDHIHGGFFRYCKDNEWQLPYFEKLLIDQAMHLWVFSLAEKIFPGNGYRFVAIGVLRCLERDFRVGECYGSAIDADVDNVEGGGTLWSVQDLTASISHEQRKLLHSIFSFVDAQPTHKENSQENDSRYHIIRSCHLLHNPAGINHLLEQIRNFRAKHVRPQLDSTILTDANSLTGIALIVASRCLNRPGLLQRAHELFFALNHTMDRHGQFSHSQLNFSGSKQFFARDAAALTLFADILYEHSFDMKKHYEHSWQILQGFNTTNSNWLEST
ncbi:MAG: thioredoxin domain-containing protein, partial [Spirochaetaceae bacterium]